jgi:hypothetical protein
MSTATYRSNCAICLSLGILNLVIFTPQITKAEIVADLGLSAARYPYPEAVVSGFMSTCSHEPSQLPPEIKRQLCTCLVSEFQNQYSYDEFEAIGKKIQVGELPPTALGETVDRCVEKVLKLQK